MIDSGEALRGLYAQPKGRSLSKQLRRLDAHCTLFVSLAPLVVMATTGADGRMDCSPRGWRTSPKRCRISPPRRARRSWRSRLRWRKLIFTAPRR